MLNKYGTARGQLNRFSGLIGRRLSVVGRLSVVTRSPRAGRWLSVVGRRSPVTGRRSSVVQ